MVCFRAIVLVFKTCLSVAQYLKLVSFLCKFRQKAKKDEIGKQHNVMMRAREKQTNKNN